MKTKCHKRGDTRIKKRFLLLPKCINGERKWLEFASWVEEYTYNWADGGTWIAIEWENIYG